MLEHRGAPVLLLLSRCPAASPPCPAVPQADSAPPAASCSTHRAPGAPRARDGARPRRRAATAVGSGAGGGAPGTTRWVPSSVAEYRAGAGDDRVGQPGQLGHMHPVRAIGAAGFEPMEEYYGVARFAHRHVEVAGVGQPLRQLHQLVIVGGEHRLAADPIVQVLADRPGDGHAVVGAGAAADLVEEDQGRRSWRCGGWRWSPPSPP